MLSLYDRATIGAALDQPLPEALRQLIMDRLADAEAGALLDMTHVLVIQPGDTEAAICREVAFSPLRNPIDNVRYGEPGFIPFWVWLTEHAGWYEMIHTVGDSGFAFILFIERSPRTLPELLTLCDEFAGRET